MLFRSRKLRILVLVLIVIFLSVATIRKFLFQLFHFNQQIQLCNKKWPNFTFFLTTPANDEGCCESTQWLLPSLALFWPVDQPLDILIVSDNGTANGSGSKALQAVQHLFNLYLPFANISLSLNTPIFKARGWDRSQWLKLWADNLTQASNVAFIDTDTVFVTRITENDLFADNGRPIVRGNYGHKEPRWDQMSLLTYKWTGLKEPFNCMASFPIIIKTSHLASVRKTVTDHLRVDSFDTFFTTIALKNEFYSEYNLICTVLWWKFRSHYYWIINPYWEPGDLVPPSPRGRVANFKEGEIGDELLNRTRPHLALHWSYFTKGTLMNVLQKGFCFSLSLEEELGKLHYQFCQDYINDIRSQQLNRFEFMFEETDFSKRTLALSSHRERLERNQQCRQSWNLKAVDHLKRSLFKAISPCQYCNYSSR